MPTRVLAERLVERIRRECDLAGASRQAGAALGEDFKIVMMVPLEALGSIAEHGFLNQHLTLTSKGFHRIPERFAAEQELAMARLPYSHAGRELLPKYAVLYGGKGLGSFRLPAQYGDVAVVFKKEVARRATWTYADSLDFSQRTGHFHEGGAANDVLPRTFLYRRKPEDQNRCGNYCEAQLWGELSFADAAYAMLRDSEPVPAALLRAGLPVYRYREPAAGEEAPFVLGELLASGGRLPAASERPSPAEAAFLESRKLSEAPEAALVERLKEALARGEAQDPSERLRLAGELSVRPKSPAVVAALEGCARSPDAATRALALYGLSELPWESFKPHLLGALRDSSWPVEVEAIAFSADHEEDADVARELGKLRQKTKGRPGEPRSIHDDDVAEWLGRLRRPRFCEGRWNQEP